MALGDFVHAFPVVQKVSGQPGAESRPTSITDPMTYTKYKKAIYNMYIYVEIQICIHIYIYIYGILVVLARLPDAVCLKVLLRGTTSLGLPVEVGSLPRPF